MTLRRAPAAATWLLKFFCSNPEQESLIGDMAEQYQAGRSRFWYWRQVLAIVFMGLYRNARRSLTAAPRHRITQGFTLVFVFALVAIVLLSEIVVLALAGLFGGVVLGGFLFLRNEIPGAIPMRRANSKETPFQTGISMHHIPVEGAVGFLFVFATVFIFAVGVPAVRAILVFTAPLGILGAAVLFYWHRSHPVKIEGLDLEK